MSWLQSAEGGDGFSALTHSHQITHMPSEHEKKQVVAEKSA